MTVTRWRVLVKLLLAGATVLAIFSQGGLLIFLFFPFAVGYWWAVRHADFVERAAWILLSSLAAAQWSWQVTYPVTEGRSPSSWIIAGIAAITMAALVALGARYKLTREPPSGNRRGPRSGASSVEGHPAS